MEIYVQTRGLSQDYDYCWLRITPESQYPEIPPMLTRPILTSTKSEVRITDLIQSESPSVVLARDNDELLLLVTGMESTKRQDFRGRKIRNSLAWVCQDSEDNEQLLRALAVQALRGSLKKEVDDAIDFAGDYGFRVDYKAINKLGTPQNVTNLSANSYLMLGKNSEQLRDDLANQLKENCLPTETGVLVVVTGIKKESTLTQAGVWRGLSNSIEAATWKRYEEKKSDLEEKGKGRLQLTQRNSSNLVIFILLSIAAIVVSLIVF